MNAKQIQKPLLILLLAGWCLLFLRCETTEKSMVRAVYLAQDENTYRVGLLYQAPEAAADASEASAALQFVQGEGPTLERAAAAAETALPQTASYRLCDYLLLPDAAEELLAEYEQLVLRRGCGRTAAKLTAVQGDLSALQEEPALPDALMTELKAAAPTMPRLYQHEENILLPCLQWEARQVTSSQEGVLHTGNGNIRLEAEKAELFRLLTHTGGSRWFWLEGEQIGTRRCTVSLAAGPDQMSLRLDCQRALQSPLPTESQQNQLAAACTLLVQECWQQGVDLLHLGAYQALQNGGSTDADPTKNVCPQIRTDVRFLPV